MGLRCRLRLQVAKAIDRVECRVNLLRKLEVGHVRNESRGRQAVSAKPSVTVVDSPRIQVEPGNFVADFGQTVYQTTGSACRLKEASHRKSRVLLETLTEKVRLRLPVGSEHQIVILGKVVEIPRYRFHDHSSPSESRRGFAAVSAECDRKSIDPKESPIAT
jgi:hypothetical protein